MNSRDMPIQVLQFVPRALRWTRASYWMISAFLATGILVTVLWWPLVVANVGCFTLGCSGWKQMDWLLIGNFLAMSLLAMTGANARADALVIFVSALGGLIIESWGTQTQLWTYFTLECPPLWIVPAWPIATLSIDRLKCGLNRLSPHGVRFDIFYWPVFGMFYAVMLAFVWPSASNPSTLMALALCAVIIATPTDHRTAVLTFIAGSGLGYFLELWGTTRECWTYYTQQTPPLFAVLAHGMAAVAFWRAGLLLRQVRIKWTSKVRPSRTCLAPAMAATGLPSKIDLSDPTHSKTVCPSTVSSLLSL